MVAEFQILGTLADFVTVESGYETLIETALNEELQYLLVPTFADAGRAIEFLKTSGAGRATFLVVGAGNSLHHPSSAASAAPGFTVAELPKISEIDANRGEGVMGINALPDPVIRNTGLAANPPHGLHQNGFDTHSGNNPEALASALSPANRSPYQTLESVLALKPQLASIFQAALPYLSGAAIVDSIDQIPQLAFEHLGHAQIAPVALVRTGERVAAGRIVTGGGAADQSIGVLTLRREISELKIRLAELVTEMDGLRRSLGRTEEEIGSHEERQRELDGELRQTEQQLAVQREQLHHYGRERERAATHTRVVAQEMAQLELEQGELETKRQQATQQTTDAEQAQTEIEAAAVAARSRLQQMRESTGLRSQELAHRRAAFAARTERRRGLQNDIRRLDHEAADLTSRAARNRLEAVEADDQRQAIQMTLAMTAQEIEQLSAEHKIAAVKLESRAAILAATRQRLDALDTELRAAREGLSQARDARARNEIEQAKLSSDLDHLIGACHNELGEDLREVCRRLEERAESDGANRGQQEESETIAGRDEVTAQNFLSENSLSASSLHSLTSLTLQASGEVSSGPLSDGSQIADEGEDDSPELDFSFWRVPVEFDLVEAKARLAELRAKIEALGPVNMMALEELTEIEERFFFLSSQKSDIERAITDTQAAIAEIKHRSRDRFREAFVIINENFKQMFQELFGGGQGEMKLIDETDVLESGIEIIAQPPGKRLQNVLLLSGGEKAMTALSLVLAIFKYRPSPFCLLDEVDAPLDEVNIGRFADKVFEMSANTQFTIITHSKRTMEVARTLYGVTMEDPGVSKLVSVKLN